MALLPVHNYRKNDRIPHLGLIYTMDVYANRTQTYATRQNSSPTTVNDFNPMQITYFRVQSRTREEEETLGHVTVITMIKLF